MLMSTTVTINDMYAYRHVDAFLFVSPHPENRYRSTRRSVHLLGDLVRIISGTHYTRSKLRYLMIMLI